jgi:hypothetical protein
MRSFYAFLIMFVAANPAAAQTDDPAPVVEASPGLMPTIAPIPYGFSNSVIDHNGRLWIFDITYDFPPPLANGVRPIPTRTTRVTLIESNGVTKSTAQFNGAFQVVGVGRYAVYALITDYPPFTTVAQPAPPSMLPARSLVALGPDFPTLPSVAVPLQAEVKASAVGDDGAPDTIAVVDMTPSPILLGPAGVTTTVTIPTRLRTVQIFRSDGKSFTSLTPSPIPVP